MVWYRMVIKRKKSIVRLCFFKSVLGVIGLHSYTIQVFVLVSKAAINPLCTGWQIHGTYRHALSQP